MRMEPPPSLACATGTAPAATRAALPPDEPPAECAVFQGLRTGGPSSNSVEGLKPNSGSRVLPSTVTPVLSNWRVNAACRRAGRGTNAALPWPVGSPAKSVLSFTKVGTPANAPPSASWWAGTSRCTCTASSRASASRTRAAASRATSAALTSPRRIAAARPTASRSPRASSRKTWTVVRACSRPWLCSSDVVTVGSALRAWMLVRPSLLTDG